MTLAPIAIARSTAAPPKLPVAGAIMMVSPASNRMSLNPPYRTRRTETYANHSISYPSPPCAGLPQRKGSFSGKQFSNGAFTYFSIRRVAPFAMHQLSTSLTAASEIPDKKMADGSSRPRTTQSRKTSSSALSKTLSGPKAATRPMALVPATISVG
jgi:hypothetical protein